MGQRAPRRPRSARSEEHTSELQSPCNLVCRLLLEKKNKHFTGSGSVLMFGGGMKKGFLYGETDTERPMLVTKNLIHIKDLHATFFFFIDTPPTKIYTLSLHDALPILWPSTYISPLSNSTPCIRKDRISSKSLMRLSICLWTPSIGDGERVEMPHASIAGLRASIRSKSK